MRLFFCFTFLASLLVLSACNKSEPPRSTTDQKQADEDKQSITTGRLAGNHSKNSRTLKPGDYIVESSGHLGQASLSDEWSYKLPYWRREGFSNLVANANCRGRKESGPVFVIITRHPLPTTLDDAGSGQGSNNKVDSKGFPDDKLHLTGHLNESKTHVGYVFVVRKKDLREDFTLLVGNVKEPEHSETKYNLSDGRLFLVDVSANPSRTEQVKADVRNMAPNKDSCVKVLRELAAKSQVAKSLLEEAQRR
jgi:hypothetical protein